jgi:diguanylate cyclase (GGDEF)-like protein
MLAGLAAEEELLSAERADAASSSVPLIDTLSACVARIVRATRVSDVLPQALAELAAVVCIDRLVIAELTMSEEVMTPRNCFVWQRPESVARAPAADWFERLAGNGILQEWLVPLAAGQSVLATHRTAGEALRERLAELRTATLLIVPIMVDETHWGQVVVHDCREAALWSREEQQVLTLFAQIIGASLTRERHEQELASARDRIALLARSDALTGLANRGTFHERLQQAFAAAQRGAHAFAVLYLDLDRFKDVNDTLGHHSGDLLLQRVAQRLREATREIDLVARLGGDEFAIVQTEVTDSASVATLAEKLIELLSAPYLIESNELQVGVSIGLALYMSDTRAAEALLAQADQALYRAKQAGRGCYRFYSDQIDHEMHAQLALAESLRGAIGRGELSIHYQPQVELASGRLVGMEALLRWNHPGRGVLLPEDFLPIAETFGIMQQLGRWVLDQACQQMALWRERHIPVPVVAVNVALAQIRSGRELVRDVTRALERWSLAPHDLELDVTELVLARSTRGHDGVLEELRQLGVGIAIDDFGAQYSSLDYLRSYRVSRLKLARGMIAAADVQPGGGAMIRAILGLARELGVEVVAEGVETEAQCRLLIQASERAQGQGFYYSQAVSADETLSLAAGGVVRPGRGGPGGG